MLTTETYESITIEWLQQRFGEGTALLKKETAIRDAERCIKYMNGEHDNLRTSAISSIHNNKIRKVVLELVSAMTDVRPVWNYETLNTQYKKQAELLNKLARAWWRNRRMDRKLAQALIYASVGGSGYLAIGFDEHDQDIEAVPYDPRDVIPINPVYGDSIQDWQGVILVQELPIDVVKQMYPTTPTPTPTSE